MSATRIEERDGRYFARVVVEKEIRLTEEQRRWLQLSGELQNGGVMAGLERINAAVRGGLLQIAREQPVDEGVDLFWPDGDDYWWPMSYVLSYLLHGWGMENCRTLEELEEELLRGAEGEGSGWPTWPRDPDAYLVEARALMVALRSFDLQAAKAAADRLECLEYERDPVVTGRAPASTTELN